MVGHVEEKGPLFTVGRNIILSCFLGKKNYRDFQATKGRAKCDITAPPFEIYPKSTKILIQKIYLPMFIAALFVLICGQASSQQQLSK